MTLPAAGRGGQRSSKPTIAAALAAVLLAGPALSAQPQFSDQRNAAASFVGTLHNFVGRMGGRCGPLLGFDPASFSKGMSARWQASNQRFYDAAVRYQSELLQRVEASGDAAALAQLKEALRLSVQGTAQGMVDQQLSGSGEHKLAACRAFAQNVEAGTLNIGPSTQFYATLQELVREQEQAGRR